MTDGVVPEVLKYLMDGGIKLTYLGDAGGLKGYLGESPTGEVQTFYLAPDGKHLVAGMLFREGGVNVTGVQVTEMKDRYEAAKKKAEQAAKTIGTVKPMTLTPAKNIEGLVEIGPQGVRDGIAAIPDSDEYISNRDPKEMKAQLDKVAWFKVGAPTAPVVYMVADPNCPFCHRTWSDMRPMVMSGEISVHVIMIAGLNGSEPEAISILARNEPAKAWFAGEGSTRHMPVASPPPAGSKAFKKARSYLQTNMNFVNNNDIKSTPHMFYLNEDGDLFESRGMPKDLDIFLSNIR
ncbi:thioredoxin fold domain-containing protein [Sulfitobacter sp. R18_1]|uniref:thioredoxin fold domain-containing protein n=1 Tax=Sulfitobacter sp. R18_1 TaxID=2821104 RepID=UPI001ADC5730|nr:thioredoxin fold domain-containing protein [Sulfitobacter sp. R18_1]MBO9428528.1 thioredoxin fold domain-containing protein [Sulfitobacter sp. R18_1]